MTGEVVEKHAGMVHDCGMGGWGVGGGCGCVCVGGGRCTDTHKRTHTRAPHTHTHFYLRNFLGLKIPKPCVVRTTFFRIGYFQAIYFSQYIYVSFLGLDIPKPSF